PVTLLGPPCRRRRSAFMYTNPQSSSNGAKSMCRGGGARPRRRRGGFTLMEVVVALAILAMITGSLFAILQGSVRGASQIEQVQRENDSINRFLDLCRKTFTTMPSSATL